MSANDADLLRQFVRERSQDAFAELVRRHLDLVHATALRRVRSPQLAEEIAQSVFTDLARDAGKLKPDTVLPAWLYAVTRRTAIDVIRHESRRLEREQFASALPLLAGTGLYEARQAAHWREQVLSLQQQQAQQVDRMRQLQSTLSDATNRLAGVMARNAPLRTNATD